MSKRAPSRSSKRLTALLIADGDIPRVCAAATKLCASTTRTKATMSLKLFKRVMSPYRLSVPLQDVLVCRQVTHEP